MIPNFSVEIWLLQTAAMFLTALIVPGMRITSFAGAFIAVLGIAFINSFLWDAALFFFLPKELSVNALLLLLTNGLIFWLVIKLVPGIDIDGIAPAIFAPIVFTVCNFFTRKYAADVDWSKVWEFLQQAMAMLKAKFSGTVAPTNPDITPISTPLPSTRF